MKAGVYAKDVAARLSLQQLKWAWDSPVLARVRRAGLGRRIPFLSAVKAELERRAKKELARVAFPEHVPFIQFIPARFTLQEHGWEVVKKKLHWDFRLISASARMWFGWATFSHPKLITKDRPGKAIAKGLASVLVSIFGRRKGKPPVGEAAPGTAPPEPIHKEVERPKLAEPPPSELSWLWADYTIPPGRVGNPTLKGNAWMKILERLQPAVLHRWSEDHVDATYLGRKFRGRYLLRLIEPLPKKGVKEPALRYSMRRFKEERQFDEKVMERVARKGLVLKRIPAPGGTQKDVEQHNPQLGTAEEKFIKPKYPEGVMKRI